MVQQYWYARTKAVPAVFKALCCLQENKCLADFLAKQGKPLAEAVEMPNMLVEAQESKKAQAATAPQVRTDSS